MKIVIPLRDPKSVERTGHWEKIAAFRIKCGNLCLLADRPVASGSWRRQILRGWSVKPPAVFYKSTKPYIINPQSANSFQFCFVADFVHAPQMPS